MKKTFKIKLDTELTIDFSTWGLTDAQQKGGYETKKLLINHLIEQNGVDDFEIAEKNSNNLFEAIAVVVMTQNSCALAYKK